MKIFISFGVLILVFTGCASVKYQQMQNERDTRREVYEDARRKEARGGSRTVGFGVRSWHVINAQWVATPREHPLFVSTDQVVCV